MKKIYLLLVLCASITISQAQVKISTPAELMSAPLPDNSSILELKANNKGILIPRMTTIERDIIALPAIGLLIFNTTADQFEYYAATPVPGWVGISRNNMNGGWSLTGNNGTTAATNFLGTIDEKSLAFRTFNQIRMLVDSAGKVGIGTTVPNSLLNIYGNNTPGFAFGANQFFVGGYSRPTRLNTAASNISYGLLSHSNADALGTYNAVAGRILRTSDTSLANLTGAIGHVNNGATFETALLGIVNSRADQPNDNFRYSAAWLRTPNPSALSAAQLASTYTIFAPDTTKSFFGGSIGIGTSTPNASLNILGNGLSATGFPFGASQFFIGGYSRPTRLNAAASEISYGLLSHTNTNSTGTYNAIAGRVLRNGADTSLVNLTAALGHVNRSGTNNFQTAVLGIVNSRADQFDDAQVFSAGRFSDAAGIINAAQDSNTYSIFSNSIRKSYFAGSVGVGTPVPNSIVNVLGNNTAGFAFGANQFFVGVYSRPTRLNTVASNISYGLLSHTNADNLGTYNAVAGRILRTGDTSLANLTAALAHVNNGGNFQTAVLGITNSRADQSTDAQNFSAARFTDATGTLNSTQDSATYTIFASSTRKNYFEGNVGVGTSFPNSRVNVVGNNTTGFAFGANQFFVGVYSRPTRLNTAASNISYGLLSHSSADNLGTYNAVAGRILRTGDTSMANLTAALGHVNNGGNFQTAVLGTLNSRLNEASDAQVFSAGRFTDVAGTLTTAQEANTYSIFSSSIRKSYFAGTVAVGTTTPNASLNILGNSTTGFAFGANQFFIGGYSRPTRLNAAASEISYGFLSHTNTTATGTYNAIAGRVLRNADSSQANLTAALGHVNNSANFQTALLGTVNSRADQASDAQNFAAARLTVPALATLTAGNLPNTYTIFAPDSVKSFIKGAIGINTNAPATSLDIDGGLTIRASAVIDLATSATVTVGNRSYLRISNGTATSIILTNGLQVGQVLIIENTDLSTSLLADAANVNVAGASVGFDSADDTVSLIWNGTKWIETARVNN
ncbi:MAG: hypothetical protein H7Y86_01210 [Rhizobacter sp.]|nr:hypothetical protein [Ferruginibacter sp.]